MDFKIGKGELDIKLRLKSIEWFENCGGEKNLDYIGENIIRITSWEEACKNLGSIQWENKVLDERGDLGVRILEIDSDIGWNDMVGRLKETIYDCWLDDTIRIYLKNVESVNLEIIDDILWDVHTIVMALSYSDYVELSEFFQVMIRIYESGHIPCGYKRGKFIVY